MVTVTESLAEKRRRLGLSQQDVAVLADCSISRVGQIEREVDGGNSAVRLRIQIALNAVEQDRASVQEAA